MLDVNLARIRAHRTNIHRYQRLSWSAGSLKDGWRTSRQRSTR